jgi:hypothetical protein
MSIVLAFNPVDYSDNGRKRVQDEAIKAFARLSKRFYPVAFGFMGDKEYPLLNSLGVPSLNILRRDCQKEISNNRKLPYLSEIFNYCSKIDCDIFGYINSDILIGQDFINTFNEEYDAYIYSRYEIGEISCGDFLSGANNIQKVWGGDRHEGRDAFFFNRGWWIDNGDKFPSSLLLGETEWDTVYRFMIMHGDKFFKNIPTYMDKRVLYHVFHNSQWNISSNGALSNIKIWEDIRKKIGVVK